MAQVKRRRPQADSRPLNGQRHLGSRGRRRDRCGRKYALLALESTPRLRLARALHGRPPRTALVLAPCSARCSRPRSPARPDRGDLRDADRLERQDDRDLEERVERAAPRGRSVSVRRRPRPFFCLSRFTTARAAPALHRHGLGQDACDQARRLRPRQGDGRAMSSTELDPMPADAALNGA